MLVAKIAATVAILAFLSGAASATLFGSPYPQIETRGEVVGGLLVILSALAAVTAAVAWIWGV